MYVCLCHGFTERQVDACVQGGARSVADVYRRLEVRPQCGKCVTEIRDRLGCGRRCAPAPQEAPREGGFAVALASS